MSNNKCRIKREKQNVKCNIEFWRGRNAIQNKETKEVYEELITTFSQQGDLILDIGSGNGKEGFCFVVWEPLNTLNMCIEY